MGMIRRLWRASVWNPTMILPEDHKYRWKRRLWLPIYLACCMVAAVGFINHGSPVLDRNLTPELVDGLGLVLFTAALTALVGVTFPRFHVLEAVGLIGVMWMVSTYAAALLLFSEGASSQSVLSWLVLMGAMLPLSRLTTLGEERKERREGARGYVE